MRIYEQIGNYIDYLKRCQNESSVYGFYGNVVSWRLLLTFVKMYTRSRVEWSNSKLLWYIVQLGRNASVEIVFESVKVSPFYCFCSLVLFVAAGIS